MAKPNIGQGDAGKSFLFGSGKKIEKDNLQFDALGALDELNSNIGVARSVCDDEEIGNFLKGVQQNLLIILGNIGTEEGYEEDERIKKLKQDEVDALLDSIKKHEASLPILTSFILPSGTQLSAYLHICRVFTRRAERRCVALRQQKKFDDTILQYLNRLSDVFFALARYVNHAHNIPEEM